MTLLPHFASKLVEHNYAPSTQTNYCAHVRAFLDHFDQPIEQLPDKAIQAYLQHLAQQKHCARSTQKQCIGALKLFYQLLFQRSLILRLPKAYRCRQLTILTPQEVQQLLQTAPNLKHRTLLTAVYSGGLRVSEVVRLQRTHVDTFHMKLHVPEPHSNQINRTLPLSHAFLALLQAYERAYRPEQWLFVGQRGTPYATSSVQRIFRKTLERSQLPHRATVHTLRHSFAVHLLDQGNEIHQVHRLLGHHSLRTTQRYLTYVNQPSTPFQHPLDASLMSHIPQQPHRKNDGAASYHGG